MNRKGFTLIEAIIGISLLGLIAVTVLPIVNSSFARLNSQERKAEMIYIGESVIEKIKAYDEKSPDMFVYNTSLVEIINMFNEMDIVEIILQEDDGDFEVKICKMQRSSRLWMISVNVYEKGEGDNNREIYYEALVPAK